MHHQTVCEGCYGEAETWCTVVLRSETFDLNPALTDKWQEIIIEGGNNGGVYACIVSPIVKEVKHIRTVVGSNGKPTLDKSMQNND